MNTILTFTLKGQDIDVLAAKGSLAYTFTYDGKPYGNKVALASKKQTDIISATFLLLENALSTLEELKKSDSNNDK